MFRGRVGTVEMRVRTTTKTRDWLICKCHNRISGQSRQITDGRSVKVVAWAYCGVVVHHEFESPASRATITKFGEQMPMKLLALNTAHCTQEKKKH